MLVDNGTRLWIFNPSTLTCSDPAAMIGFCDQAQGSNRSFYARYRESGGSNGHFSFPVGGPHDWSSWGPELATLSDDLVATIR
ncbi:putative esterase [Mycobacteroides abscessus subsp. bolletii]|nr:putative esterase [Mycobacteroides abscessus subsp. bolletii]SKQ44822.1 putative esterase [Mycobacteroides abscessus subsp. bolletii]SKQ48214.1 putative esterase [Mycobacteroides abscessus subsp. bolletii]SKQ49523.1 putative esterase [Mycobacteroides abscessus subsp. bolletii]